VAVKDAGPDVAPYTSPGIRCGTDQAGAGVYCPTASEMCCARRDNGDVELACVSTKKPDETCGGARVQIRCDDQTDCPTGQVCCGAYQPLTGYRGVACATSCNDGDVPGFLGVRFCDAKAPVDECAAIGLACTPSKGLDGLSICN
jgi:hypothetical protein